MREMGLIKEEEVGMAKEDEEEDEEKKASDDEFEKAAAELGSFIERGMFDTLTKLGSERHEDPMHYFYPYIEEKVAAKGAKGAIDKMWSSVKNYHKGAVKDVKKGVKGGRQKVE